jgi:hypothetical protein
VLPVASWRIIYADGSEFTSADGTWAEAPPFGVQAVVYYHVDDLKTVDGGGTEGVYYYQADEFVDTNVKLGLFIDGDSYYRIMDLARRSVEP